MTATDAQIKSAYEQSGMTPQEIAVEFGFVPEAVKAKLMQISTKYRKDAGLEAVEVEDGLNFTNEELRAVNRQIFTNAISATLPDGSPDFRTMQRACEYIRDDKKGRKEIIKAVQHNTFNMIDFNNDIQRSRLLAEQARMRAIEAQSVTKEKDAITV